MRYPSTEQRQKWLKKAPENNPHDYLIDRAFEEGIKYVIAIKDFDGISQADKGVTLSKSSTHSGGKK